MKLRDIVRNTALAIPLAAGLWGSSGAFGQTADQVRMNGTVKDTSGHVVENVNVKIWKSDDPTIFQLTETDFLGQYLTDISTPVEDVQQQTTPLTILNNGNSRHIGFTGTLPSQPHHINIINSIGQVVDNIPFDYDPGSQHFQADWRAEQPGVYFAQIQMPTGQEVLKFIATQGNNPPALGYAQTPANTLKHTETKNGEQIKYYIELTSDGDEQINFHSQKDSVLVSPGAIAYPEHSITPIIPDYNAIINGQVTLAGLPVGPHFRVMLSPEQGDAQELFTDENGAFNTTIDIPPEQFPYGPATIALHTQAQPTSQSIQTTNAEQTLDVTNNTTPYNLELAVDSAYIALSGYLGSDVSGNIIVNGKTIHTGDLPEHYAFTDIKTIQQENNVHYELEKYHHEPINHNANVNVWNTHEFSPTFVFIPAEYTATITGDENATITIQKAEGEETLWNFTSTGTQELPTLQRNELDSILVNLNAELEGKLPYDTTFYLRENLPHYQPNNITFTMQDEELSELYGRAYGQIKRNGTLALSNAQITYIMHADTLQQFEQLANEYGVYNILDLPTDADGENYIVRILPSETSQPFLPYETTTTIHEGDNRRDFTDVQSIPQKTDFNISTYNEKDSVALSNVLVSYYLNGPDGFPQTPDDILFAQTTSANGNATITDVPAGSNGYFEAQMTGANADDYFKYSRARFSTPATITQPSDTLANVLFLMVEQEQTIPGTQGQASMVLDDAYQVRSRQGGQSNPWSVRGQPYKLSTAQLVNDAYGTVAEKIAQLERVIHETDSLLYDGRQTIILTDEAHPAIIGTGARADPYTEAGQEALDSLGFYATVGNNITITNQKILSYYSLNGFDIENGQTIMVDGETKMQFYSDDPVRKEIYFRLRGRGHPNGIPDNITRTTEHLIDRMEQKTYNAFYNHNTTSYTARHLYTNDE
jgi:hypothetical protein